MSFDSEKIQMGREHIYVVEIDLDYCSLTFGTGSCVGGDRTITTTAVSVDDFSVGDEIEGGTSGAIGIILTKTGTSPTYTFKYRITNGIDFQTAAETITNNTATGVATKNGSAPILVSTGDQKCFNTLATTQDDVNYDGGGANLKTYRFYTNRSPVPDGISAGLTNDLSAIPNVLSVSITPSKLDVGGGLSTRTEATIRFNDHPHSDIGIDKYITDRTWIASDRGTFWTKFRARNPNYENRPLRILSGYLVNGVFDAANFETRHYIIDRMDVSGGTCEIKAKDVLKLAMSKKAQVPAPSNGYIQSAITAVSGSLTLIPAGIGNAEYPASGKATMDNETVSFTRSGDSITLTVRGQNNTVAAAHAANATFQLAYENNDKVNAIVEDILTNYANVPSAFIPSSTWEAEVDIYLNGLLDGIITKPTDVFKILKELSEAKPHYLWWDERNQIIQLTALKAPPLSADVLTMDDNIIGDSFRTMDKPDMRISTVFVNYGQYDPTKKLDEPGNWQQTYARVDSNSIQFNDNIDQVKVIYSRWISDTNAAGARQLAALIGRRFAQTPRMVNWEMDPKDSDVWIGQSRAINHRDIVDPTGLPVDTVFQIISSSEGENYKYSALEFNYGDELAEDEGGGEPGVDLVILTVDDQNINLRTIYNGLFPTPDGSTVAKFVIDTGVIIGSSSTGSFSLDTGSWPVGATVILQTNSTAFVVGRGGDGSSTFNVDGDDGGPAIILNHDLELINNGVIGGGGGGGAANRNTGFGSTGTAAGGGGAGNDPGDGGTNSFTGSGLYINTQPEDGTLESGGFKGSLFWNASEPVSVVGADGGDLGQAGSNGASANGGAAGLAIDKNGYTLTETVTGDIRGSVIA